MNNCYSYKKKKRYKKLPFSPSFLIYPTPSEKTTCTLKLTTKDQNTNIYHKRNVIQSY